MAENSESFCDCLVKLGGAAITNKQQLETLDEGTLRKTVEQVKKLRAAKPNFKLVIIHGAGSFGHFQAKTYGVNGGELDNEETVKGFVQTRLSVTKLNHLVVEAFVKEDLPAVGLSPCGFWSESEGSRSLEILKDLLNHRFIPVIHGDAVIQPPRSLILSGDALIYHHSLWLKPKLVLFLSNVHGVYDRPPELEHSEIISTVAVDKDGSFKVGNAEKKQMDLEFTTAKHDTTGGMEAKVRDAVQIARQGFHVLVTKAGSEAAFRALEDFPQCLKHAQWCGTHFQPSPCAPIAQ